jgi:hypothetical protein
LGLCESWTAFAVTHFYHPFTIAQNPTATIATAIAQNPSHKPDGKRIDLRRLR